MTVMQNYEESVSFLGTWGPFQRRSFLLLCLVSIPSGYNVLSVIFLLATPPHHCHIPAHSNLSQDWIQASIPVQPGHGGLERSSCNRYSLDLLQNLSAQGNAPSLTQNPSSMARPVAPVHSMRQEGCRDGWDYSNEYYGSTVVTEFNLVCNEKWKQPLTSLIYFLGAMVGCFISGPISDGFGRKLTLFCCIAIMSIFNIAAAFASSWIMFVVLFFFVGMGQITSYIIIFVLGSEILIGSKRVLFSGVLLPSTYVFGMVLLPATAHFIRSWTYLSLMLAVPGLAVMPLMKFIPESPRWLVSRGRLQEAERLLRLAALENRVEAPQVIFVTAKAEKSDHQEMDTLGFLDLLRTTTMRKITIILWLIWFSTAVAYFGLSFNMSSLNGNPYLSYFLVSIVEVPAYITNWLALRSLPRRWSFISFTLLGALSLLLIQLTLQSNATVTLVLVLLGKYGILVGIATSYIYSSELSPTSIRNTAMSSNAMFSRLGSAVSPYLLHFAVYYEFLPWIIVGSLSLLAIFLAMLLPETFRQPLPDTIQQLALRQRFTWPCCSTPPPEHDSKLDNTEAIGTEVICMTQL